MSPLLHPSKLVKLKERVMGAPIYKGLVRGTDQTLCSQLTPKVRAALRTNSRPQHLILSPGQERRNQARPEVVQLVTAVESGVNTDQLGV